MGSDCEEGKRAFGEGGRTGKGAIMAGKGKGKKGLFEERVEGRSCVVR